jgi:hypothetical protein
MNEAGDHEKLTDVPLTDPFKTIESPEFIFRSGPASAQVFDSRILSGTQSLGSRIYL